MSVVVRRLAHIVFCAAALSAVPAWAQTQANTPATAAALSLNIDAPAEVQDYLSRHLELLRYNALDDLDTTEVDKLVQSADMQARELLGTLGYFSPSCNGNAKTPTPKPGTPCA